ncbi:MAG: cytochrome ubiquinol oxidase subunit I [Bdellovibrionota bacterium]|nr:cytochrome ubiquinol oxidase subunit I [Bdellovibrionota bacterium]
MTDLLAARSQMALSLAFHIIFAIVGMVMPFFMARAHWLYLKKGDEDYLKLTKFWMKGVAIFFATGAVSGTALSFELGLLWPEFMKYAGPIIGMPFSWEGTAFFLEAIFLGLYLYGFNRLKPYVHWTFSLLVGLCGLASGIFIMAANSWMNSPSGFDWNNGVATHIDPVRAMFNDAWLSQAQHMMIASFVAVSFLISGLHFIFYLKNKNDLNIKAIKVVQPFLVLSALLIPLSGDFSAKDVAKRQPLKLAAMESHFHSEKGAGLILGGLPNKKERKVEYGLKIPYALSFLATGDFNGEVLGLEEFPEEEWPPLTVTHIAFQIMVGLGTLMAFIALLHLFSGKLELWKKKWFLILNALATPFGLIALEAGWVVTEVGRQPWIIYGLLKTSEALTPVPGIKWSLLVFTFVYLSLSVVVMWLMTRQFKAEGFIE